MRRNVLSLESLNIPALLASRDQGSVQRGQAYYRQGRAYIERVQDHEAYLRVLGTRIYHVHVGVEDGAALIDCTCPVGIEDVDVLCKHKVAAVLKLQDYLRAHPPTTWETVLGGVLKDTPRKTAAAAAKSVLFFSLQKRGSTWGIYPYSLPASSFPPDTLDDPEAVARTVKQQSLGMQVKGVRSGIDSKRFVNVTPENQAVAQLAALVQQYAYYYYSDRDMAYEALLPRLSGSLVFRGTESAPLKTPVRVLAEPGTAQVELIEDAQGLRLVPAAVVGDETFRLRPEQTEVFCPEPLWVLSKTTLFRLADAGKEVRTLLEHPDIVIPAEDREAFLDRYLLPLAERVPVTGKGLAWEDAPPEEPVRRLYLSENEGELQAHLRFGYGDHELAYDPALPAQSTRRKNEDSLVLVRIARQPEKEQEAWTELSSSHGLKRSTEPGRFTLRARVTPVDFLLHQIPRLAEAGFTVFGEEALTKARVNRNRPTIAFKVSSGIDWFDVEAVVSFGDMEVALRDLRRAVKKRERYIQLADGSIGAIPDEWIERYRHLFALGEETGEGVRLSQHHLTLLDAALAESDGAQTDAEFARRRDRLKAFEHIAPHDLPDGFVGDLRPYQKAGYDWLHFLHKYEWGGCLADDMGVGKTIQALVFLQSLRENGHAKAPDLLVMPRSLIFNWQREAARFTPNLKVLAYADGSRPKETGEFDNYDLVLTTYGILLRDIERLRNYRFHYALLDESQAIKNPAAQTAKAARLLQADHRLVLTGTPVENSSSELWSQFAFLNPGLLGSLDYFKEEFAGAIERKQDEQAAQLLRKLVYPFILRRTKDQVARDLPPRTERTVVTEMEPAQRKLYNRLRDHYRAQLLGMIDEGGLNNARMKVLEGLLRLRQVCNHPRLVEHDFKGESAKMELLLETLETLNAEGHKALVFSQFTQMLALVRDALDARGVPYMYLDGRTQNRQERVDRFQNDPAVPFFLVSLKAGGVGLNLTAADYVIHIDPWWNPAVEMQATDRAHRIGQDKPVFVYKLIAKDSVEEKILQLQDRKRALVDQLIATEGGLFKSLTRDDVKALFE